MIIRVLDQNYFVQQTLPSEEGLVQYVCTNVSEDDGRTYRIVRIPTSEVQPELIRYLANLYKEGLFHELIQYGNEKGHFHVVMDCGPTKARTLQDRLQTEVISLAERLVMGDNFLKYLIVSSIPLWFAESSMHTDHILFTDALECALDFELEFLMKFEDADMKGLMAGIREVLSELFAKELDKEKLPEMKDYLEKMLQGEYSDLMSAYQEYRKIELSLAGVKESSLEPKSLPWRLWDRIKSLASHTEKLIGVLVFAIVIAYLIWSVWNALQPTKQKDIYPAIGDEKILSSAGLAEGGKDSSASDDSLAGDISADDFSDDIWFSDEEGNLDEEGVLDKEGKSKEAEK
ncbi:MAG: hypothetical protein Q4A32_01745 [Lachnospiraceae bacterium]|nr:hypothetical protein [Lachnospiraceae bacterium]